MGFIKIGGYLCNFMKGNYGIKKLYGGAGREYGGGGRICLDNSLEFNPFCLFH